MYPTLPTLVLCGNIELQVVSIKHACTERDG